MIRQYGDWMRDDWNHPSVAIWDANNETLDPLFGEKIIPAVRPWIFQPPLGKQLQPARRPERSASKIHPYLFQPAAGSASSSSR